MNTISELASASAAVTGARHLRASRNGQDAAGAWVGAGAGAIVVCDGCGSGASSEVGARLGAQLVIAALATRLEDGARVGDPRLWEDVRREVVGALAGVLAAMTSDRPGRARAGGHVEQLVHDHLLFTIVAAAVRDDDVAVWSIGDGAYALGHEPRVLGPFADNQPPYLAYDLLGAPAPARLAVSSARCGRVVVATDGIAELGLEAVAGDDDVARYLRHPDALRRRLALLARTTERIAWAERRIERTPAALQDDGAVALLAWRAS